MNILYTQKGKADKLEKYNKTLPFVKMAKK